MRKSIKDVLRSLGLFPLTTQDNSPVYSSSDYEQITDEKMGEAHMAFLYKLDEDENNRLTLLEGKTSQLIAQTGIIFSLLSLFVPLLIDKVVGMQTYIKVILLLILLLAFCCYMLTIKNALKNFKVTNFPYSKPSAKNVITFQRKPMAEFYCEVIKDILYGLQINKKLNNTKASNLLHSYTAFRAANTLTAVLVSCFCISLLFLKQEEPSVSIKGQVKIENFDKYMREIIKANQPAKNSPIILPQKDTLIENHSPSKSATPKSKL